MMSSFAGTLWTKGTEGSVAPLYLIQKVLPFQPHIARGASANSI